MTERDNGWYLRSEGYMTSEYAYQRIGSVNGCRAIENHGNLVFVRFMGGEQVDSRVYAPWEVKTVHGFSLLFSNIVVKADRFTDSVHVLKKGLLDDYYDVATYVPRSRMKEAHALIRDMLEARCGASCADCPHEEDGGCEFMRRAIEVGAVKEEGA